MLKIFTCNTLINFLIIEEVVCGKVLLDLGKRRLQLLEPTIQEIVKNILGLWVQFKQA